MSSFRSGSLGLFGALLQTPAPEKKIAAKKLFFRLIPTPLTRYLQPTTPYPPPHHKYRSGRREARDVAAERVRRVPDPRAVAVQRELMLVADLSGLLEEGKRNDAAADGSLRILDT